MNYLVIVFRSRNDALTMRSYLGSRGITCAIINAPRAITHSCGIALKINNISPLALSNLMKSSPTKVQYTVYTAYAEQGGIGYRIVR